MAKLSQLLAALEGNEEHKGLVDEARAELGDLTGRECSEIANAISDAQGHKERAEEAEKQNKELASSIESMKGDSEEKEKLQKQVEDYRQKDRDRAIKSAVSEAAKKAGIRDDAVDDAAKLVDVSGAQVNLDTGDVSGIGPSLFEGWKDSKPWFFGEGKADDKPGAATPLPNDEGKGSAQPIPQMEGAAGKLYQSSRL